LDRIESAVRPALAGWLSLIGFGRAGISATLAASAAPAGLFLWRSPEPCCYLAGEHPLHLV
jgi:hypothetical protein